MKVYLPTATRPIPKRAERITLADGRPGVRIRLKGVAREFPLSADAEHYIDKSRFYWGRFTNIATGKVERVPLKVEDKKTAEKLLKEIAVQRTRQAPNPHAAAERRPLSEHVADFARYLRRKAKPSHADLTVARVERIVNECAFVYWSDIAPEPVEAFLERIGRGSDGKPGVSIQTRNFYLAALKQFCRWATLHERRFASSPVSGMKGANVQRDRRHDRRALTHDELRRFIAAAESGPVRGRMPGVARAMLYRLAVSTGLRAGELRSLTWASLALDATPPTVTVSGAYSKNGRTDELPLTPDLCERLRSWKRERQGEPATAPLFAMPSRQQLPDMVRADLAAARASWIAEARDDADRQERERSDFLAYKDHAGRFADFHSLRHTFITNLARGGVAPKVAQDLARHSDINLTLSRYSHTVIGDRAAALAALPSLDAEPAAGGRKRRRA